MPASTPVTSSTLSVRRYELARDESRELTELDSRHVLETVPFSPGKTALLLLDVWSTHPNRGWFARATANLRDFIVPLTRLCRAHGIPVLHVPTTLDIHPDVGPDPADVVIRGDKQRRDDEIVLEYCRQHGIDTILYAGWAANLCMWNKDANIKTLSRKGLRIILVRDATIAFESHESLEGEWFKKWAIFEVERRWGSSTTVADLRAALGTEANQPSSSTAGNEPAETTANNVDTEPMSIQNKAFQKWQETHPGGSFAEFYVDWIAERVLQEKPHNTLGKHRSAPERFEATGKLVTDLIVRKARLTPASRVLDYGCGSLRVGKHLLAYLDDGGYLAMDIRATFYREGLAVLPKELQAKRHQFSLINDRNVKRIASKPPDGIVSIAVLHHVPPTEVGSFLDNICAMTGPNTVTLVNFHPGDRSGAQVNDRAWYYSKQYLTDEASKRGCRASFFYLDAIDEWYEGENEGHFLRLTRSAGVPG